MGSPKLELFPTAIWNQMIDCINTPDNCLGLHYGPLPISTKIGKNISGHNY